MYAGLVVAGVVPAWNEERLIGRAICDLPDWVDHVIVVDDGSHDATTEAARVVGDERLVLLRHARNRGVGAAIVTGYREAHRLGADVAVVLAGDAQMDPAEMDRLIDPIADGSADYVKGNRLSHPELGRRMPASRRVGNLVLTHLTRAALGVRGLTDSQCGYTAISRGAMATLPLERVWPRYGYPNDLLSRVLSAGLRVAERPVTPIYGEEQSGIRPAVAIPTLSYVLARAWLRRRGAAKPTG